MSQATKEHILQTASSLMGDAPSSSISLRDFAEAAEVSKALLLKYFGSRSNFLIQVLEYERLKIEDMWSDVDGNTSIEDLCLRLVTAFQVNPRYFKLVTRLTLENNDPDVQNWLKERFIYGRIQKVVERLQPAKNHDRQFKNWSPEAFGVFAMVCSFALPVLGPKVMEWYEVPENKRTQVEQEVLMLCINAMVTNIEGK
jgi:AcrR family transcriptional regulator